MNKRLKSKNTDPLFIWVLISIFLIALAFDLLKWTFEIPGIAWIATAAVLVTIYITRSKLNNRKRAIMIEYRRQYLQKRADLDTLKQMPEFEFKQFISDLFVQMGYNAFITEPDGKPCEDLIVSIDDFFAVVSCQNGEHITVTKQDIKRCENSLKKSNASFGFLITTGQFDQNVQSRKLKLIDGQGLIKLIDDVTAETEGGQTYRPLKLLQFQ
ncbi:restriction endonuclease [Alkalibacillus silvisoli]|uniref:Restriction endonuclease type IV Mrr domain-containing protein n=1 Tax=Alkalibacillus silvisoli TaxID=392823 RepID=A0ABN0ZLM4_9BACI